MNALLRTLLGSVACVLLASCSSQQDHPTDEHAELHISGDTVTLTPAQRSRLRLTTTTIAERPVTTDLTVAGRVDVPPQNIARIGSPMGGVVRSIAVLPGSRVHKGQVIVTLDDVRYVDLQRDYLMTSARIELLQKEQQRQRTLASEQINAGKVLEQVDGEVRTLRIQRRALEEQLALLQIDARTLTEENISRTIRLKAPIDGYVTGVYAVTGAYSAPNDSLVDIVRPDHLHIEMEVFERDITAIREGQPFRAVLNDTRHTVITGTIHLVGKNVAAGRTVVVHGHPDRHSDDLLPGTTLSATIAADPRSAVVVPSTALISDTEGTWIYVEQDSTSYVRYKVERGVTQNGNTEVVGVPAGLANRTVVVRGAAMLNGTFNKGPGHSH